MPVPSSTTYSRRLSQRALALEVLLDGQVEADDAEHDPDDGDQEAERGQQAAPDACFVHRLAVMDRCPGTCDGDRQRPVAAQREQVIEQLSRFLVGPAATRVPSACCDRRRAAADHADGGASLRR
jgi:hypothetical protein